MRNYSRLGQLQTPVGFQRPLPNPQQAPLHTGQPLLGPGPLVQAVSPLSPLTPRAREAQGYLRYGLGIAAILAGGDKLLGISHEWEQYISPQVRSFGIPTPKLIKILGGLELAAGLATMADPGLGGRAIATLILGDMINVMFTGKHWDIVIKDLGLLLACIGLVKLED